MLTGRLTGCSFDFRTYLSLMELTVTYPQFFTATILEWQHLLKPSRYKMVIIDSLRFLIHNERIWLYGYVIMDNHIHLIWHIRGTYQLEDVQRDFLKFTAQQIIFDLKKRHTKVLARFEVNACDRKHQVWERKPLSIDLWTEKVLAQKLAYLHQNPVRAGLCERAEAYLYSSAAYYNGGTDPFGIVTHYKGYTL